MFHCSPSSSDAVFFLCYSADTKHFFRGLFQVVTFLSSSFVFGSETTIETSGSHGLDDKSRPTHKLSLTAIDTQEVPRSK